jgi:hypothetical protein
MQGVPTLSCGASSKTCLDLRKAGPRAALFNRFATRTTRRLRGNE